MKEGKSSRNPKAKFSSIIRKRALMPACPVMSGSFLCFMTLRIVASLATAEEQNHFYLIKPSPLPDDDDDADQGPTCRCRASIHMALSLSLSLWPSIASPSSYGFFTRAIVVQLLSPYYLRLTFRFTEGNNLLTYFSNGR